jgi:hypothetical protein
MLVSSFGQMEGPEANKHPQYQCIGSSPPVHREVNPMHRPEGIPEQQNYAAIVFGVLLPLLGAQNGLGAFELTYLDKKRFAEPALRPIAEALKIGLAREVARLRGLGRLSTVAPEQIIKTQPGTHQVSLAHGRTVELVSPKLSLAQAHALLSRPRFSSEPCVRTAIAPPRRFGATFSLPADRAPEA